MAPVFNRCRHRFRTRATQLDEYSRRDVGVVGDPVSIIAADLNHDGVIDLATAYFDPQVVSVYLGKGDGTFDPGPTARR